MHHSLMPVLISLIAGILLIVLLTARYRVHAFFALLVSCFVVGLGVQLPVAEIITAMKDGFGNIMKSIGLIIVFGTVLGVILEHTGSTRVMADYILRKTGEHRAPLAMNLTGLLVGLPIFCDSGYVVLSGLNKSLAARTGIPMAVMAVSLATGLYSIHCLVPPHPGAAAAAGIMGVDFGRLILIGAGIAIPAALCGYLWANYAGKKSPLAQPEAILMPKEAGALPAVFRAFLPVLVPVVLIALRSFLSIEKSGSGWRSVFFALGDPVAALAIGILLALLAKPALNIRKTPIPERFSGSGPASPDNRLSGSLEKRSGGNDPATAAIGKEPAIRKTVWGKGELSSLLQDGAEKAGGILVIIGAGGAFGSVLAATHLGEQMSVSMPLGRLGIFFPFLLTFVLKTAQGSSTVAIITAASIIHPLLPALDLNTANGQLLCILSMGAGSMMISHANDAYFWVVAKFSGLDMRTMLRVYTLGSVIMGIVSFFMICLLKMTVFT
jgi:GntP family gluconate:H+ symporter